jgi:hypothetical protein
MTTSAIITLMNLDISTGVQTAVFLTLAGVVISLIVGIRTIQAGNKLLFFRKRRDLVTRGWRLIFVAIFFGGIAFVLNRFAEPLVYRIFPPSPTVTTTPTITLTPTVTLTLTITETASITPTISITPTPHIPTDIFVQFTSVVTPNPAAVFSKPVFSKEIDKKFQPVDPATEFTNPVGKLFATFSYDKMTDRAQWTAMWVRLSDNSVICFESIPWDGGTGGYGYTQCSPGADKWLAGDYEVQVFVGTEFKVKAPFIITGNPPTATVTLSPTRPTSTPTSSITPSPTLTRTATVPSSTPTPSYTPTSLPPSWTPIPSITRLPTLTPDPSVTASPTLP